MKVTVKGGETTTTVIGAERSQTLVVPSDLDAKTEKEASMGDNTASEDDIMNKLLFDRKEIFPDISLKANEGVEKCVEIVTDDVVSQTKEVKRIPKEKHVTV